MDKKLFFIIIFILCMSFVLAQKELSVEVLGKIDSVKSSDLKVISSLEKEGKGDIVLTDNRNLINIKGLDISSAKLDELTIINISKGKFKGSDVISIESVSIDNAKLIFEKYWYGDILKPLYRENKKQNWTLYNGSYDQNSTHLWLNTTHFSEFTTSMPDIWVFKDSYFSSLYITLTDFATIDEGDHSYMTHAITESSSGSTGTEDEFSFSRDVEMYTDFIASITAYSDDSYLIDMALNDDTYYVDTVSFSVYTPPSSIHESETDIDLYYVASYTPPSISFPTQTIGETSATLRGNVDFKHARRTGTYYDLDLDYDYSSVKQARFRYKKNTEGWLDAVVGSWTTVSHSTTFSLAISDLIVDTNYDVEIDFKYYDVTTNDVETITNGFSFKTLAEPVPAPSVDTLTASTVGETTATIRGLPDFDGYTEAIRGRLCYREGTSGAFNCNSFASVTDDTIFTRDLTGLTVNTSYQFYAEIDWDSAGFNDVGDILTFTTTVTPVGGLTEDLISYWKLDETTGDVIDFHGTNDGTNNGTTRGVTGKLNNAFDFDGTNDYVTFGRPTTLQDVDNVTVSIWINADDKSTYQDIMNAGAAGPYGISVESDGRIRGYIVTDATYRVYIDSADWSLSTWRHIVLSYDGTTQRIYLDGVEKDTNVVSGTLTDSNSDVTLGARQRVSQQDFVGFYNGKLDEVGIWSRALTSDEITELYNSGNALSYDDFDPKITPTTTTLSAQDITQTTATVRQLPDFGEEENVWGVYQLIKVEDAVGDVGTWDWTVYPSGYDTGITSPFTLTNNTIHSIGLSFLRFNTKYHIQGVVVWDYNSTSEEYQEAFYSEYQNFTTLEPIYPEIEVLTPLSVGHASAVIRGRTISLGSFDEINVSLWFEGTKEIEWTTSDYGEVDGIQGFTKSGLAEGTEYCYTYRWRWSWEDDDGIQSELETTNQSCFTTGYYGDPIINTLPATSIKRDEALIRFELFDLGIHDDINVWFKYWNEGNESNAIFTDNITYYVDDIEVSIKIENLFINTTYEYEALTNIDGRNISGGILDFKTKSLLDFLAPEISLTVADYSYEYITVNAFLDMNDANITDLYFYLFDADKVFLEEVYISDANETKVWSATFDDLESITRYYYQAEISYYDVDNASFKTLTTDYDTLITLDIYETPITICPIERFCIEVQDRYLFMLLFMLGISILGLGFAVGYNMSNSNGAEKILVYAILGMSMAGLFFLYLNQIMPPWIFIYSITGVILMGILDLIKALKGGAVYG